MDYPYHTEKRTFVPLNVNFRVDIFPEMILADERIKTYSLKSRNCFINEREWSHVKIFKVQHNISVQFKCCLSL